MAIKSIIKDQKGAISFAGAETISKAFNWGLPFLLFFLSRNRPETYGLLAILIAFERTAGSILDLGQKRIIYRYFDKSDKGNNAFLSSTLTSWLCIVLIILFCFVIGLKISGSTTFFKLPINYILYGNLLCLFLNIIANFITCYLRIDKQIIKYSRGAVLSTGSKFFITLIFSIILGDVLISYVIGEILADVIFILCFQGIFKEIDFKFTLNLTILKRNMIYGYPLALELIISSIGPNIDKFFLSQYVSLEMVGNYNFVLSLTSAFAFLYIIGTSYFEPMLFRKREDDRTFLNINNAFISLSFLTSTVIILLSYSLLRIIGFDESYLYLIIAIAYLFQPLYYYNMYTYMAHDKNIYVVTFTILSIFTLLVLDAILIKNMGTYGAAIAYLLYTFVLSWVSYSFAIFKFPQFKSQLLFVIGLFSTIFTVLYFLTTKYIMFIILCLLICILTFIYVINNKNQIYLIIKDE